ncbi:hypothetical protein [Paenibacillus sp. NAIST15-1]|uniref:hypothetical protein n=1 Tax=Paenibacillus sp. NAIST15-1 TaxID=1605994 RepID=UPI00086CA720|nr:hypothetical protein [Paenibacillus sp. NAIST15-1]GAV15639.1 hypothetical protein PBN151_5621 [Paenibacillus sp. NAIST15-1]
MREDKGKPNRTGNGNQYGKKKQETTYVTLPYDFIPFAEPEHREFPYECTESGGDLPKHNDFSGLSGCIEYEIRPHSDLAIEVRKKWSSDDSFISGSAIRGKVRANAEILSAGYPEFINRTEMLYRDISDKRYRNRLLGTPNGDIGIERAIHVGFLKKKGNEFYVAPASKLGDKFFLSIKEHRLMQMNGHGEQFATICIWDDKRVRDFNKKQDEIEQKTREIKQLREQLKETLKPIQSKIDNTFIREFALNRKMREVRNRKLNQIKEELFSQLIKIQSGNADETEIEKLKNLYRLYVDRWGLKAELNFMYEMIYKNHKNSKFIPYQRGVYFKSTANGGIEKLACSHSKELTEKGYLFNSSNASSKRSHYFVLGPAENAQSILVPQSVINAYNQNLDKFRITDTEKQDMVKAFYNIFDEYEKLTETFAKSQKNEEDIKDGLIVFYQCEKGEVKSIGRTPYFKIPYIGKLGELIGVQDKRKIDYANALFGFIPDGQDQNNDYPIAYKSRIRFSPLDIRGQVQIRKVENLLLMTPSATASGMYLRQTSEEKLTYEDENIKLNGYKHYHVLPEPIEPRSENEKLKNMVSTREVISCNDVRLTGKINFRNLSEAELGLLLLSLDWKEVLSSSKYSQYTEAYREFADKAYELIGGAKPYGFGKVQIHIKHVQLERKDANFDALITNPIKILENRSAYIEQFIDAMYRTKEASDISYFDKVHFENYVLSKVEESKIPGGAGTKQNPKDVNWDNAADEIAKDSNNGKGGGYPKSWRLKTSQK